VWEKHKVVSHGSEFCGKSLSKQFLGPNQGRGRPVQERKEGIPYLIKHILELILRQGRALDVLDGAELLGHALARLSRYGPHLLPGKLLDDMGVVAQVDLRADDEARHARAVVVHFWEPLLAHVLERRRRRDAEAHQEHVRLRVRQRAEPVVVFLAGRIEEAEGVGFVTDPASSEGWRFSLGCGTRDILVAP
jgi:hypothetical protein